MRKVASFSFSANIARGNAEELYARVVGAIQAWIALKGPIVDQGQPAQLRLRDGRLATLRHRSIQLDVGALQSFTFQEPSDSGAFRTLIRCAVSDAGLGFETSLWFGAELAGVPIHFDAFPPRLIADVIGLSDDWAIGANPITDKAIAFNGALGGEQLAQVLWHPDREVPVVVVSDNQGLLLSPAIHQKLAIDLAGLALVARVDSAASWKLTQLRGREWSCYAGAIRLYYPKIILAGDPYRHPSWTLGSLLAATGSPEQAASKIRETLRRRTMALSAFATGVPKAIVEIEDANDAVIASRTAQVARDNNDWDALERLYAEQNDTLQAKLASLEEENADLKLQLANVQSAFRWSAKQDTPEPQPDEPGPPESVVEAVLLAKARFGGALVFGDDVERGIKSLADDAGPPAKVFSYLETLSELSEAKRRGPLGTTAIKWLRERNVEASGESETILNSAVERNRRTFHDGVAQRFFEMHLKPADQVSPDRCVRIYFDYDDRAQVIRVGWVGRHPGT